MGIFWKTCIKQVNDIFSDKLLKKGNTLNKTAGFFAEVNTAWSVNFCKRFPSPLLSAFPSSRVLENILYLFNECSPQTPLSGWKSLLFPLPTK